MTGWSIWDGWFRSWNSARRRRRSCRTSRGRRWSRREGRPRLPRPRHHARPRHDERLLGDGVLVFLAVLIEPAVPLEHFGRLIDDSVERHADLPGPGKDVRVLDGRFVLDVIAVDRGVA